MKLSIRRKPYGSGTGREQSSSEQWIGRKNYWRNKGLTYSDPLIVPGFSFQTVLLYVRTAAYLTGKQLVYRVWYDLRRMMYVLWSHADKLLPRRAVERGAGYGDFGNGGNRTDGRSWNRPSTAVPFLASFGFDASDIIRGRFCFLNEAADLGSNPDWRAKDKSRLWRYNLHYFSYLMTDGGIPERDARHLIEHWIAENPPGTKDSWDPFPVSLRVVNWIKYFSAMPYNPVWVESALHSACVQVAWLDKSLEYHLLGNHLFKNAKALIFAGIFLFGRNREKWMTKGLKILKNELREQILPDGGHFERSPMYHSMILEDCLDLLNAFRGLGSMDGRRAGRNLDETIFLLEEAASKMAVFLQGMVHPDGQIPLFNDSAFGIEQDPERLLSYCETLTGRKIEHFDRRMWSFPQSGFFVMAPRPGDRLIADCGVIGATYQPGHAHCDLLSFELSLKGRRVIVDSGCSRYEEGEIRRYNRGNIGHNTITVDGRNQSEVWGAHRCARRARPLYARLDSEDEAIIFAGAHDGYKRRPGRAVHHRSIRWTSDEIQVRDYIDGKGTHSIESRLHIHPDLVVSRRNGAVLISDKGEALVEVFLSWGGEIGETEGWYSPEFGIQRRCTVLRVWQNRAELPYSACWTLKLANGE
jgi:uncharacterized heparinase superfamily protein